MDNQIEEAAKFYVSLLPDSIIENTVQPDPNGHPQVIEFTINIAALQAAFSGEN